MDEHVTTIWEYIMAGMFWIVLLLSCVFPPLFLVFGLFKWKH